jgi:hypothetical protein
MKFTHWAKPTKWGEPPRKTLTELPEGVLSDEAKHAGHCHSFAMALAQLTGRTLYGYLEWDWRRNRYGQRTAVARKTEAASSTETIPELG